MANTSNTIKYLDELIIKVISVKVKNAPTKPVSMTPLKYSLKTEALMIVYFETE